MKTALQCFGPIGIYFSGIQPIKFNCTIWPWTM